MTTSIDRCTVLQLGRKIGQNGKFWQIFNSIIWKCERHIYSVISLRSVVPQVPFFALTASSVQAVNPAAAT